MSNTIRAVLSQYVKQDGKSSILLYVYANGQKRYIPTGLSIPPADFTKKGRVKKAYPQSVRYNRLILSKINEIESQLLDGVKPNMIGKGGGDFISYLRKYIEEEKVLSDNTIRKYRTALNHLESFMLEQGVKEIEFDAIDRKFGGQFLDYLSRMNAGPNGKRRSISVIKKLMGYSQELGYHDSNEWTNIKTPPEVCRPKIYLSKEEIEQIRTLDLSASPHLERHRDLFLIGYRLIMRYCDVVRINRSMVIEHRGKRMLSYTSQKTNIKVTIPLTNQTHELIAKYDYILDFTTNQQINRELKRIAAMAGLTYTAQEGKVVKPKCELVTFHTARRSGATNAYMDGMNMKTLLDVGGWKKLSTLQTYLRASGIASAELASEHTFFQD